MGKPIGYNPARLQRAFRTSIYFSLNRGAKHPFHCAASAVVEAMAGQAASQARLQRDSHDSHDPDKG